MNVFYLNKDPVLCAQQHCDKHVVKMIVESAQLLSTAHRVVDSNVNDKLYKIAHKNHPSAIWCRQTSGNYMWLFRLFTSLLDEYEYRYVKSHKCWFLVPLLNKPPKNIVVGEFTPPPLAMPDQYKVNDPIKSYHNYYNGAKTSFARWKGRSIPTWFNQ